MTFPMALILFGLISLIAVGIEIMFTYATQGFPFGFSSNRPNVEFSPLATRMKRAFQNHVEAASYIVPVFVAGAFFGISGNGVELATALVVIGRAAFIPLYWTGISFIRVPAFVLGSFGTFYIIFLLLTAPLM